MAIQLIPSVKLKLWRQNDAKSEEADREFEEIRQKIVNRDGHVCQGCGMKTLPSAPSAMAGHFDIHHIDDNHDNNHPSNLVTICPFCHNVFHIGNAGARGAATGIWMPQISQADMNLVCHILFILMFRGEDKQAQEKDIAVAKKARDYYRQLKDTVWADELEARLGAGMSDLRNLGEALAWLGNSDKAAYDNRMRFLGGLRIIPVYEAYREKVAHYARATNFSSMLISAETLSSLWSQWKRNSAS